MSAPLHPQPHRADCRRVVQIAILAEIRETRRLDRRIGGAIADLKAREARHAEALAVRSLRHRGEPL